MGKPVSILSLAKQMIYLSGLVPQSENQGKDNSSIEIKFTGLKRGEKIHEELFIGNKVKSTEHPMIMEVDEDFLEWSDIDKLLTEFLKSLNSDEKILRDLLMNTAIHKPDLPL